MPQNPFIIHGTIKDNIVIGNDKIDIGHLKKCLLLADLKNFVRKKSRGLGYSVGLNGNKLSGGEKQKIAICRGLYRQANFILFDESLSNIDEISINIIKDYLKKLKNENKSIIIISHKKDILSICDKIYNLKDLKFYN